MASIMKARMVVVAVSVVAGLGFVAPAFAAGPSFTDCKSMNAVYPNGVARTPKAAKNPSPFWIKIKPPVVDPAAYATNKKLDRDGDGIACEVAK